MAEDTGAGNLEVQKAINEAISARNALLLKQTELMKGQLSLAIEFQKLMRGENLDEVARNVTEINRGLESVVTNADGAAGSLEAVARAAAIAEDAINGIEPGTLSAAKGLKRVKTESVSAYQVVKSLGETLGEVFENTGAEIDSLFTMLKSTTSAIFGIGSALVSIPLKIFGIISDKAAELMNSSTALREAYENVRETFGDLSKAEAKGVLNSFSALRSSGRGLAGTGLSLTRIYGPGPDGLAAALNELNETAAAMGPVFGILQDQFEQNADKILIMQKGMGLGNEEMKALGQVAIATGGDVTQMMQEMGNLALQMGEKFGISSKLLGKDLGYMTQNMGKFGSMTKTQMITSAVYVRKLGLEIKDLEGLMGTFDNFEDAATNAAKLAQGFGMTIDAMKMMKEQDPAKRLDMLRQSFAATGRSIESMSRQEKAMLAQSAGLDENMVSLALSNKNMGKSYEQIQKEAEKSNKKQLTQAEVMDKLSENIKKFTQAMQHSGSFFTQFFNGMMKGFSQSPEFMKLMRSLGKALTEVYWAGVKVGRMIMDTFPGLKDMFNSLSVLFSGSKFKYLLSGVTGAFKTFFIDLQKDPVNAAEKFMKTIKDRFFNFFDPRSRAGLSFRNGLTNFLKSMSGILGGAGKWLIEGATTAIKSLTDYIKNPEGLSEGAQSGIVGIIQPMIKAFGDALPGLYDAIVELLETFAKKHGGKIATIVGGIFALELVSALGKMLLLSMGNMVMQTIAGKIKSALSRVMFTAVEGAAAEAGAAAGPALGGAIGAEGSAMAATAGGLLSNPAGWAGLAAIVIAAIGAALGQALKAYGRDNFVNALFGDKNSMAATVGGWWYDSIVASSDYIVDGIGDLFGGLKKVFGSLFTGTSDELADGLVQVLKGLVKTILGLSASLVDMLGAAIVMLSKAAFNLLVGIYYDLPRKLGIQLLESLGVINKQTGDMIDKAASFLLDKLPWNWSKAADDAGKKMAESSKNAGEQATAAMADSITSGIVKIPKTAEEQLDSVTSLVGEYSGKTTKQISLKAVEINKGLDNLKDLVSKIDQSKVTEIETAMKGIDATAIDSASKYISEIGNSLLGVIDAVKDVGAGLISIDEISRKFNAEKVGASIEKLVSSIGKPIEKLYTTMQGLLISPEMLVGLKEDIAMASHFSEIVGEIASVNDAFNQLAGAKVNAASVDKVLANSVGNLSKLEASIPSLIKSAVVLSQYANIQLGGTVQAIVDDIRMVNDSLANLGDIDVNSTIDHLGESLKLKTEVLNIERKPIQMTVNLNLTMKSEDIAKEILEVSQKATLKSDSKLYHQVRDFLNIS